MTIAEALARIADLASECTYKAQGMDVLDGAEFAEGLLRLAQEAEARPAIFDVGASRAGTGTIILERSRRQG